MGYKIELDKEEIEEVFALEIKDNDPAQIALVKKMINRIYKLEADVRELKNKSN